jgi:NitT/TauT family transport system ATP-binding protein
VIEVDRVEKVFETQDGSDIHALSEVSVSIDAAEFVVIVGPSGCGKSTLLRLVAGLVSPSSGAVRIAGTAVVGPREDVGIVFQAPTLLPWANLLDNVLFPFRIMRRLDRTAIERAMALLDLVGLKGFERRMPRELSGGMQQRAAICRALVHDPSILLMDEPFGALDALTREEMSLELMRIWSERPKTILFVTHSVPEAVLLADRVVVLGPRPGRVIDVVPVGLPRPRSLRQEAFPEFQDCAQRIREHIFGPRAH